MMYPYGDPFGFMPHNFPDYDEMMAANKHLMREFENEDEDEEL